jgi:cation:H+ antiporter
LLVHVVLLLTFAGVIYLACEWFVNAIEWLGVELRVGTLAVGTVLAAIGTALPESVVTLVAVLGGSPSGKEIGVGAALGGPLVLATLAYAIVGVVLLVRHRPGRLRDVDEQRVRRDQGLFAAISSAALLLGLVSFPGKAVLGLAFFAVYAWYVRLQLRSGDAAHTAEDLEPLRLQPHREAPGRWAVVVQTLGSLVVVVVASQLFVGQLEWAGPAFGIPAAAAALLLSPVATELPEIMNAVIWVRQDKQRLALANISGAMMVQATVPAGIGLLFTPWHYDAVLLSAAVATIAAIGYLIAGGRLGRLTAGWLAGAGVFYLAFAVALSIAVSVG